MKENSGTSYLLALVIITSAIALLSLPTAVLLNFFGVVDWLGSAAGSTDESRSAVLRNLALMFSVPLAAIGIWIAWRRNVTADQQTAVSQQQLGQQMKQSEVQSRQYELAERSHDYGRYENGVTLLGNNNVVQQLSGVSVLRVLAEERREQFDDQIATLFADLISGTTPLDAMRYTQGEDYEDKHFVDSRTELALWNALFDPNLECATSNLASIRIHSTVCPIYLFGKNIHREVTMENVFFEGEVRIFCIPKIEDDDIPRINFRNCYIFHLELIRIGELDSMQFAMFINCRIGNTVVDDNIPLDILEQLFSNCTDTSGNRLKLR